MKRIITIIALTHSFALYCAEDFYTTARSLCDWSMTQSEIIEKSKNLEAQLQKVPEKEVSLYNNYILNHINSLNFDNSLKPDIYFQKNQTIYRDFIFLENRLSAVSCHYTLLNENMFMKVFSDLKKEFGAPDTKRDQTTTTHTFKKDNTTALFMIRSKDGGFEAKLYFYTNDLFKRVLINKEK